MTWANNKLQYRLVRRHAFSEWRSEFGVLLISLMKKANIYIIPFRRPLNCFELFKFPDFLLRNLCSPGFSNFKGISIHFPVKTQWNQPLCSTCSFFHENSLWFRLNYLNSIPAAALCTKSIKYFASLKSMMVERQTNLTACVVCRSNYTANPIFSIILMISKF